MTYSPQITKKYGHHYGQELHGGYIWPYGVEGFLHLFLAAEPSEQLKLARVLNICCTCVAAKLLRFSI